MTSLAIFFAWLAVYPAGESAEVVRVTFAPLILLLALAGAGLLLSRARRSWLFRVPFFITCVVCATETFYLITCDKPGWEFATTRLAANVTERVTAQLGITPLEWFQRSGNAIQGLSAESVSANELPSMEPENRSER